MNAKIILFGLAIAIVFPAMLYYGVNTFLYLKPNWHDYQIKNEPSWNKLSAEEREKLSHLRDQKDYEYAEAEKKFSRVLFLTVLPAGILAVIAGAFCSIQTISIGLIFGGIISIITGYFNHWQALPQWFLFVSLLLAFLILLFVGYKKLGKD